MRQKIKICILSELAYSLLAGNGIRGGAELQMTILAKELVKRSYDVSFVTFDKSINSYEIIEGIKVYNPFNSQDSGYTYLNPKNLYKLLKILKKINADIYIQRGTTPLTGVISFFTKSNNKVFLYSVSSDNVINIDLSLKSLKDLKKIFFWFGVKNCNLVLCQTQYQKDILKQVLDKDGKIIKNFYPFTTIEQKQKDSSVAKVLWVGLIRKEKRPDLFLKLAKLFPEHSFLMIGGSSSHNPDYYDKIKESAKMINNLIFIGYVPHDQIHQYYEKSHLLVNTSANEGFPNTFLEAWGNANPVVSLNFDPDEIICKYKLGFHSLSFDDLVKDIRLLLNNEELRITMGINAKNYVLREHNINSIMDEYEKIINEIKDIEKSDHHKMRC
jgi:glycosyltransferase involved in cell wall biosynthesis